MQRRVVIFDVDKTLVRGDLHALIVESWASRRKHRAALRFFLSSLFSLIPHAYIRRKFEYLMVEFVDRGFIRLEVARLLSDGVLTNQALLRRIGRYRRIDCDVVLVTAAPEKVAQEFSRMLKAEVFSSRMRFGCLTNDLLGKKSRVYVAIERQNRLVRTIYSDSHLDFWCRARKNILVEESRLRIVRL